MDERTNPMPETASTTEHVDRRLTSIELALCDVARAIGGDLPTKVYDWLYNVCRLCDYIADGHDEMVGHRIGHREQERATR